MCLKIVVIILPSTFHRALVSNIQYTGIISNQYILTVFNLSLSQDHPFHGSTRQVFAGSSI